MSDFVTPGTVACQVPLPMEFSRQEYWSHFLLQGNLPDPGSKIQLELMWGYLKFVFIPLIVNNYVSCYRNTNKIHYSRLLYICDIFTLRSAEIRKKSEFHNTLAPGVLNKRQPLETEGRKVPRSLVGQSINIRSEKRSLDKYMGGARNMFKITYSVWSSAKTELFLLPLAAPEGSLCVYVSLSRVWLFVTPWTVAHQAPLSMEFSRQEYLSGLPLPSPGHLPYPGIKPGSPASKADS